LVTVLTIKLIINPKNPIGIVAIKYHKYVPLFLDSSNMDVLFLSAENADNIIGKIANNIQNKMNNIY